MFNNDVTYASSRLVGTWVLPKDIKDNLFYVDTIQSNGSDKLSDASIISNHGKPYNIEEIYYSVGPIGYVPSGIGQNCGFVYRNALRNDWRQGLRSRQLGILQTSKNSLKISSSKNLSEGWISQNYKKITKSLRNIYDPISLSLEIVEERGTAHPISKDFAICPDFHLIFKGNKEVGAITDGGLAKLFSETSFLSETLCKQIGDEYVVKH